MSHHHHHHRTNSPAKAYDFLLKFLLVGDSDVGKGEILASLQDGAAESPYGHNMGIDYKTTTILLDGRRVKLQLCEEPHREDVEPSSYSSRPTLPADRDTSGQGRFCTIFRSYSRGAQGVILVYDITNRWSFDGIDRWIKEIDEHAPGVPKILVGNRLHLAYKRQVTTEQAQLYAERLGVTFFEVSPLCNFNITESFTELARIVLMRHGMERLWKPNKVLSLQDLCCRSIVSCTPVHLVDKLPLPPALKSHLKSFSMANGLNARMMHGRSYSVTARTAAPVNTNATTNTAPAAASAAAAHNGATKRTGGGALLKKPKLIRAPAASPLSPTPAQSCARNSCKIS